MEKMKRGKKIEEGEEYNNPLGDRLRQYVWVQQLVLAGHKYLFGFADQ